MAFDFSNFNDSALNEDFVEWLVNEQAVDMQNQFGRLWEYYHNRMYDTAVNASTNSLSNDSARNYIQGQEYGLPARITGIVRNINAIDSINKPSI